VELISETVQLKKVGAEWQGLCPYHADKIPSLKVDEEKGLWTCFACRIGGSAFDWVIRRDGVDFKEAKHRLEGYVPIEKTIIATYDYSDAQGRLLFQVVRYHPKGFSQRQPDGKGGWLNNLKGIEPVLYNLQALATAEVVYICEGEKDANWLISLGLIATTSPGGAANWKPHYAQSLASKKVICLPHNDVEGERYIAQAVASLKGIAKEILTCHLPGLLPKGDVSDWLDAGNDVKDLEKHCQSPDTETNPWKPEVKQGPGFYEHRWANSDIMVKVARIREHTDGRVTCEIIVRQDDKLLHQAQFNLSSQNMRAQLAKILKARYSLVDWDEILQQVCVLTLDRIREGEPVTMLTGSGIIVPPKFLIRPLVYLDTPVIFFGEKEVAKSQIGLLLLVIAQLPWADNPLRLEAPSRSFKGLYLDWETSRDIADYQLKMIVRGMSLENIEIAYRRCYRPLVEDLEEIHNKIDEVQAEVILVDSLGPACAGDLNKSEVSLPFFNALRGLGVTSILIGQTSKNEKGQRSVFGSTYFQYMARAVWEFQRAERNEHKLEIGLFQRHANLGPPCAPLGLRFSYFEDGTIIERVDVVEIPGLAEKLPIQMQLKQLLLHHAPLTVKQIAEELELSESSIRVALHRNKGQFVAVGKGWGLAAREQEMPEAFR